MYTAKDPVSTFLTESVKRKGLAVTNEWVTDLIRGSHGGGESTTTILCLSSRSGKGTRNQNSDPGTNRGVYPTEMSLSPDGAHLLLQTEATHVSSTWSGYEDQFLKMSILAPCPKGGHTGIYQYELVDTITGTSQVLLDAPIAECWIGDGLVT